MIPTDGYASNSTTPGVALFDNTTAVGTGWASLAGEPAIPIKGQDTLTSAGLWMVNLGLKGMKGTQLDKTDRFRGTDYLKTGLNLLAEEIGCAQPGHARKLPIAQGGVAAARLSGLFRHVMDVACRLGVVGAPARMLLCGFRAINHHHVEPPLSPEVADAITNACDRYTYSQTDPTRAQKHDLKDVTFVRHRWNHARDVLAQMVPYGRWRWVPMMSREEILQHPFPLLLEIHVNEVEPSLAKVLNFGGKSGNDLDAQPRRWMTAPEYVFLSAHAKIAIISILQAESYIENPLLGNFPTYGRTQQFSPAFQLAIESYWTAGLHLPNAVRDCSSIAAWMLAYDRIACVRDALHLLAHKDLQVDVLGFGLGKVRVSTIDPNAKFGQWLREAVQGTHLIPPLAINAGATYSLPPKCDGVEVLQAIQISGEAKLYDTLDERAIKNWDLQLSSQDLQSQAV